MAYDWNKTDDSGEAERLPLNMEHDVEITKVIFGSKKNGPFLSKTKEPRIMVVMTDAEGREAACMITLSDKAAWVLKAILSCAGANMAKFAEKGVEPADFATDEEFGTAQLVGRKLRIRVKSYSSPDGNLAEITPLRPRPDKADVPESKDDNIPF